MCRWMAYFGDPVPADELLFRPEHSIIDQSLHAQLGGFTTNGDGFGIGWYGDGATFKKAEEGEHDALVDIRNSIAELKHYRTNLFKPAGAPP